MSKDGFGIEPQEITAKTLAKAQGWTEARARYVLDGLVERGLARPGANSGYLITGRGLAMGERMGVVIPLEEAGLVIIGKGSLVAKK